MSAQDGVAGFAALLRELKDRTDRSYGSLARRLNMNTSTLHRYCAGEAVPVDFAPVERFAALCGATGEERLELHRRWLHALESRQRPRGTDGSAATETPTNAATAPGPPPTPARGSGTGSESGPDSGPDSSSASGAAAAAPVDGGTADGRPDAVREPGGEAASERRTAPAASGRVNAPATAADPAPDTARDDPSGPAPEPWVTGSAVTRTAGESPHAGGPPSDEAIVSGPLPGDAGQDPRPWYLRRKRVAAALATACALLATVGSLSALPDGRAASADRETPGGPTSTSVTTGPTPTNRSGTVSPSPSPSGSRTATGSTPRSTTPGAGPGPGSRGPEHAASSPPESKARPPAGTPPLTWSADSHVWAHGCGHDYVIAKPPKQVPPPPAPQDAGTWAGTQSAVHGGETLVELSVQGTSDTAVVLTALRVRVAGRTDPAPGNAYAMDQGCGGALTPRYFDVDLDKDRPIARAVAGNDAGTPIPAVRMPYRVSATDPEVLRVTARTTGCDCRWYLELDWSSQGRSGTVRVDDHGRPFRTSGVRGLPHYEYDTTARGWRSRTG
ncbi:helix-turn-helix domain-containing protein [Streptomyces sp. NPDC058698]|uniref:transcriptional regulator n=1 Tax=Streptomyces sp. NPDC058698 TaxID=3346606 RepID=UPI0036663001